MTSIVYLIAYVWCITVPIFVANRNVQDIMRSHDRPRASKHVIDILERRKLESSRKLASVNSSYEASLLGMDCGDMVGYPCQVYIQNFLETYVNVNKSYNRLSLPVAMKADAPIDVEIVVTFVDLVDVNTVSGTMTTSIFIDYLWTDAFMSWNKSLTDNDGFIVVPNELLWIPDILIYNSIGGFDKQIDRVAVFLQADGTVWWSGRGVTTFSCTFDTYSFPFDSQKCTAEFSSWVYSINNINISAVHVDVLSEFQNLAWDVDEVSGRREIQLLWGGDYTYTFGMFDVYISRYYNHYISSAILPAIIITSIVLTSLWMGNNYGSRLSLGVTGLLTMTAIQVCGIYYYAFYVRFFLLKLYADLVFLSVCVC